MGVEWQSVKQMNGREQLSDTRLNTTTTARRAHTDHKGEAGSNTVGRNVVAHGGTQGTGERQPLPPPPKRQSRRNPCYREAPKKASGNGGNGALHSVYYAASPGIGWCIHACTRRQGGPRPPLPQHGTRAVSTESARWRKPPPQVTPLPGAAGARQRQDATAEHHHPWSIVGEGDDPCVLSAWK